MRKNQILLPTFVTPHLRSIQNCTRMKNSFAIISTIIHYIIKKTIYFRIAIDITISGGFLLLFEN